MPYLLSTPLYEYPFLCPPPSLIRNVSYLLSYPLSLICTLCYVPCFPELFTRAIMWLSVTIHVLVFLIRQTTFEEDHDCVKLTARLQMRPFRKRTTLRPFTHLTLNIATTYTTARPPFSQCKNALSFIYLRSHATFHICCLTTRRSTIGSLR